MADAGKSVGRCRRDAAFHQVWEEFDGGEAVVPMHGSRRGALTVDWNGGLTGPQSRSSGFETFNGGCASPPSQPSPALQRLYDRLNAPFLQHGEDARAPPPCMRRALREEPRVAEACWETTAQNGRPCIEDSGRRASESDEASSRRCSEK